MDKMLTTYIVILRYSFIALLLTQSAFAQEEYYPYTHQSFLIIAASTDYKSAKQTAIEAKEKLGFEFPASIYYPDPSEGFKTDTICGCGEIHSYSPRGRSSDGKFISIEYSTAYDGLTEGYYIVIVSSGEKSDVKKDLASVKKHFSQAYIKNSEIYVGCMH